MNTIASPREALTPPSRAAARRIYRHRLPVRLMHWINAVCLAILLMSGLTIFNAHPSLYWGHDSTFDHPWLSIGARPAADSVVGVTTIGGATFDTNGVLGASKAGPTGEWTQRAFPSWATIPSRQSLAVGRHWHFFFAWLFVANGVCYVLYAVFSGHFRRDLLPTRDELRRIGGSIADHLRFRHPTGEAARRYNVLQNLAYLGVMFGLLPLIVLAGCAMSPRLDAVWPGWIDVFGGRQGARSVHFLAASGVLLFVAVHVFEVIVGGVWNQLRSMVTGYYVLPAEKPAKKP